MSKLKPLPKYFSKADKQTKLSLRIIRIENWIEQESQKKFAPKDHGHKMPEHNHPADHTHDKQEERSKPKPWWKKLWNR